MIVNVTLTTAGTDTGPFNIFSNADNYATALATNVPKSSIAAPPSSGYTVNNVPDTATTMRVTSTGICTNSVDIPITVTYVMILGPDYDFLQSACTGDATPTFTTTYTGNLGTGTTVNGAFYSGDIGFMKILSSTQPGFGAGGVSPKVGDVLGFVQGSEVVNSIDAC